MRVGGREIDLLARRGTLLVVCEVKARRGSSFGTPGEAVGPHKRRRLREAAEMLMADDPSRRAPVRRDRRLRLGVRHLPEAF